MDINMNVCVNQEWSNNMNVLVLTKHNSTLKHLMVLFEVRFSLHSNDPPSDISFLSFIQYFH